MSFILDALKKSENDRQQQATAEFSSVPQGRDSPPAPRWLWVFGLLLAINLIVVVSMLLRSGATAPATIPPAAMIEPAATAPGARVAEPSAVSTGQDSFEERVAAARQNLPPPPAESTAQPQAAGVRKAPVRSDAAPPPANRTAAVGAASLPSLDELRADGRLQLTDLHIDLHVYNESSSRRFVSINAQKVRENETLDAGPRVAEITRDGVVLVYQGMQFFLRK